MPAGWRGRPVSGVATAGELAAEGGAGVGAALRRWRTALGGAFVVEIDNRRLFPWIPVFMALGILLAMQADGTPSPWPPAAVAAVAGAFAWQHRGRPGSSAVAVALTALATGFAALCWRIESVAAPVLPRALTARVTGHVLQMDPVQGGARLTIRVTTVERLAPHETPHRIRVTIARPPAIAAGDHIAFTARLTPPPQPLYPGGYDFARDAYFLRLGAVGRIQGPVQWQAAPSTLDIRERIEAAIDRARNGLTKRIHDFGGGQAGALAAALVTGKRGQIGADENAALRAAGLYHIVSISGLHMVLAAGVFFWSSRLLLAVISLPGGGWPIKKLAAIVAMGGATAYCVFSGSEVATERSLVMTLVMLGAILVDRPALSMRNVAIAAIIVLLREPETLLGPSFQMSFAAVMAMVAAFEAWQHRSRRTILVDRGLDARQAGPRGLIGRALQALVTASLANIASTFIAGLATAPFAAYHFNRLTPYGMLGNLLALPFVSLVVMPAAVVGTLLFPFGLDYPVWILMGQGTHAVLSVSAAVAALPHAERALPAFGAAALLLLSGGLVILCLAGGRLRWLGLLPLLAGATLAAQPHRPDILVDRDGRQAAIRSPAGPLVLLARQPQRFATERWLAQDGDLRRPSDPALRQGVTCDPLGCTAPLAWGGRVALVLSPQAFEEDCRRAALVITPLAAPAFCARQTRVIDRATLAETSALALSRRSDGHIDTIPSRPVATTKPWYGTSIRARSGLITPSVPPSDAPAHEAEHEVFNSAGRD